MIISRTPFRISFCGGGTDLREYYSTGYGAVVSLTIKKYMYIAVNERFDNSIRVSYSRTEIVDDVERLEHQIVRACLIETDILKGIEITSISDIPAGTGLGSSGSFTVGLLNALYTYKGELKSAEFLAEKACEIEVDLLKEPIGKQDQFAAAFGGVNYFRFHADESVTREKIDLNAEEQKTLESRLLLFYTGDTRSASTILQNQKNNTVRKLDLLDAMRNQSDELKRAFLQRDFAASRVGGILHQGWSMKKQLSDMITNDTIDWYYERALAAGASGGKILGAGGGGFLLICCDETSRLPVIESLADLRRIDFHVSKHGSRIIFLGGG